MLFFVSDKVQLADGGEIALHWVVETEPSECKPIALFIPGVHGDSKTAYMRLMISEASRLGFRCVSVSCFGFDVPSQHLYFFVC